MEVRFFFLKELSVLIIIYAQIKNSEKWTLLSSMKTFNYFKFFLIIELNLKMNFEMFFYSNHMNLLID